MASLHAPRLHFSQLETPKTGAPARLVPDFECPQMAVSMAAEQAGRSGQDGQSAPQEQSSDFMKSESSARPACALIEGDNLLALRALAEEIPEQVSFVYLDPPYLTGREHHHVERTKTKEGIERNTQVAFDDRWQSLTHYLQALKERLIEVRRLLADHGSVVVHVDSKTSHYAKVMCDEIFGIDAFASEVIWRYRRWPSKTPNFQRVHDVMLRYVKNPNVAPRFNQLYEALAPSTQKTWGDRKQKAVVKNGKRVRSSSTEEVSRGVPLGDVWEIPIVAPVAKERTGYPTQKPEALLRRWIESCSNEQDLILDPYMGSGTTLVAALKLNRRVIGMDMGKQAHEVTRNRLEKSEFCFRSHQVTLPLASRQATSLLAEEQLSESDARESQVPQSAVRASKLGSQLKRAKSA